MSLPRTALLAIALTAPVLAAQQRAVATITAADIAARVSRLADDSMRGRFTPSPELDKAAAYIAAQFARFGLEPAGDSGTFIQRYRLDRPVPDTAASWVTVASERLAFGRDVMPAGLVQSSRPVTGRTVVVTGMAPPDRPLDLAGAVVVVTAPLPPTGRVPPALRPLMTAVQQAGPAAVVIPVAIADEGWREVVAQGFRTSLGPAWRQGEGTPSVYVREGALAPALAAAGVDLPAARQASGPARARPIDLPITVMTRMRAVETTYAPNVVGLLRGSDPTLAAEVVAMSAHMDHVGVTGAGRCRAVGADSICNGADDNASGTVSVVELAEAFATLAPRPRRSLLFVTVSGEERGLWGSDYLAAHPPMPIGQIVADLNLDMVGRNWKDTIVAIGREHSDLGTTLARVEAARPELHMTVRDDPWPQQRFYYRSDHYNFARRGVPILFFFNGTHEDYHRPSDHPDKIDAEKQARITRLVFYLGLEVANAPERPKWVPKSYEEIVDGR
jgi:Peptidase family M28